MPVQNSISSRIRDANIAIRTSMVRSNTLVQDIEKHKVMHSNTFYVKQANADRFKLSDLWRLDDIIHFTDEEILQMFGRHRKG